MMKKKRLYCLIASTLVPIVGYSQQVWTDDEIDIYTMSPFEVSTSGDDNYFTTTTLAGNRLSADIRDLGTSLSIYNEQFMNDIGATDNQSLLRYTLGTEVGGVYGNFSGSGGGTNPDRDAAYLNPQSTNRVRGLVSADSTRDLYLTSIPWEGYNVEAVDIQRGPNAILFGQGSAGGVINTRTKQAMLLENFGEAGLRIDQRGSFRATMDWNQVVMAKELAVRVAAVYNETKFQQKPAFEDFNRQYVALRYEPEFLKRGDARTVFRANYEMGTSKSNRPRNMPPGDRITPWFTELDQQLYNVAWMNDGNWQIPGRGDAARQDPQNSNNPNFQPWVGGNGTNFGNNYYGGAIFFYESGRADPLHAIVLNPNQYLGLNSLGERDGNIGGLAYSQPRGVAGYRDWAHETGQPFASLVKNKFITDPTVFDFYNNLLDGDIKREWHDFDAYNIQVSQTFFNNKLGVDFGFNKETFNSGNYSPLQGENGALFIDFNERWADGTNTPETGWHLDGTRNLNAGRPFVQLGNGENRAIHDRESVRVVAFANHDFTDHGSHWLYRLLGVHTVTGMYSRDKSHRFGQSWVKSTFIGDYFHQPFFDNVKANNGRFWADFVPWRTMYVGDNLVGKQLGQDLGIRSPRGEPQIGESVMLRYFNPTWNAPNVNPGDPWYNQVTVGLPDGATLSTQAENPANYIGWVNEEVRLLTDSNDFNRELLTTSRSWDDRYNRAHALVWQGKFWDNAVIATAGFRRDKVTQTLTRWNRDDSILDPTHIPYNIAETGPIKENSRSWGVVAHLDRLPYLGRLLEASPVSVSVSYNKSDNFQTGQVFVDYWGQDLPLPKGETEDMGIAIATRDGRYSLRVNKFESAVANNVSSWLQFWNYGNNVGVFAQTYHQVKYNYEHRGNPDSRRFGDGIVSDLPEPTEAEPNPKWNVDFRPREGETLADAAAREIAVINAWDQWLEEMYPLPQLMASAWSFAWDGSDFTEQGIEFRLTEDLVAEGYEIELNAQVTDNLRLSMNASRIESIRDNIGQTLAPGGEMSMIDYLLDFDRRLNETVMGDLPMWGTNATYTAQDNWRGHADGDLKARLAEQGTVVPENRLWRVNIVSNYSFNDGKLIGLNVGGALRYQSAATLAYTPIQYENYIGYDLDAPYRDDAQIDLDLWVGYRRMIWNDRIEWHCQLNITNVGVGNELIPVTVQPDGTPAAYRIRPSQNIFLTNTFRF